MADVALEFEREKWRREAAFREREVALKERDEIRLRWSSPFVLAVIAALAAIGSPAAVWWNGIEQRKLEAKRFEQALIQEALKSSPEQARIIIQKYIAAQKPEVLAEDHAAVPNAVPAQKSTELARSAEPREYPLVRVKTLRVPEPVPYERMKLQR